MIRSGDIVGHKKGNDFRSVVLKDILNKFSEKAIVKIVKIPSNEKINKIAEPSTIDSESDKIIHSLIKGKVSELKEVSPVKKIKEKIIINPLYLFSDKEVLLYAKLKGLKYVKKTKVKKDDISNFIENLEKKHPEVKRAIVNSYLKLYY